MEPLTEQPSARLRIGELSRRVGVEAETLRAWERRYGLLEPERTEGNFRLYSADDEERVRAMVRLRSEGVATAEAARLARHLPPSGGQTGHGAEPAGTAADSSASGDARADFQVSASTRRPDSDRVAALCAALESFEGGAANAVVDDALAHLSLRTVVERVVLPALRRFGDRWAAGEVTVAQEHFATNLLRGRLLGLGRGWGSGRGPVAILACPQGERHDLALIAFGLLLREQGWRITFLGADIPIANVAEAADALAPDAIVLAALDRERMGALAPELHDLADGRRLYLAGAAADATLARVAGASYLAGEPGDAAVALDRSHTPA
jgi:DNA-binding transcriptional MerR regulator